MLGQEGSDGSVGSLGGVHMESMAAVLGINRWGVFVKPQCHILSVVKVDKTGYLHCEQRM